MMALDLPASLEKHTEKGVNELLHVERSVAVDIGRRKDPLHVGQDLGIDVLFQNDASRAHRRCRRQSLPTLGTQFLQPSILCLYVPTLIAATSTAYTDRTFRMHGVDLPISVVIIMSQFNENIAALRVSVLKAKTDLDSIARRLEEEFASPTSPGAPLHRLLKSVTRLEADISVFEADYNSVQAAKRELLECSKILVQNWKSVQSLRRQSGLPDEDSRLISDLEETVHTVRHEIDPRRRSTAKP